MKKTNPDNIYKKRIEEAILKLSKIKRIELILSLMKLSFVIGGVFFLFRIALKFSKFFLLSFVFFLVLFTAAAVIHEYFIKKRKFHLALKTINENEIEARNDTFLNFDCGDEFNSSPFEHEYALDLDLFGEKSVFHYINRTTTGIGKKYLADWLKTFPGKNEIDEIKKKQEAVKELVEKIDLRQKSQVHGMFIEDSLKKVESFHNLLDEPYIVLNNRFLIAFIHIFPLITVGFVVMIFFNTSWLLPVLFALIQGAVNFKMRKKISNFYYLISQSSKILNAYSNIITEIEKENYKSPKLKKLQNDLSLRSKPASVLIKKLATLLGYFDMRQGREFHFFLNNILFWDLNCVYRIEKWKKNIGKDMNKWFNVIGEFEALSSFACMYFNNPDWTIPQIGGPELFLNGSSIGHPLIPSRERVCNDIKLKSDRNILIVTGPNMAGKTTFLKTLGVNIILALAGAPVCAERFTISPLKLYTSMKVNDSLDKGLSLFYAELQRLKMVLDAIMNREPVFFLIDEMLKGTNTLDRQKGSIALIKQLIEKKAEGIIATHDLELARLKKDYPKEILNFYFDGYIKEDKLLFDYKLKKGVCESSNALELMKKIGINV